MRKLEVADCQIMQIAVQQEIQRNEDSRYDHRLHGVLPGNSWHELHAGRRILGAKFGNRPTMGVGRPNDSLKRLCCIT